MTPTPTQIQQVIEHLEKEGYVLCKKEPANLEALISAAETVVDRWDSPNWIRGEPHTGELILNLRKACDAVKQNAS